MLKSVHLPAPIKALSTAQKLLVVILGLVVLFLVIGTLNQQTADPGQFSFGIQAQPFPVLAFLAFAGGLLSFVSPCTLPVLTAYFAFAFQSDRSRIAANTLAFMLGLATTFSLFGAAGFAIGQVLLQNQQIILLVGGAFIVGFGVMSLLGKGFGGMAQANAEYSTSIQGSYVFGLTFAVGWSSCVGPILGSVMTLAAQTASVWQGIMLLFIYTLGLGLPLILVSTIFGQVSRKSVFWRVLKGKGWEWDTHLFVVAFIWSLAIWRILVAVGVYAFRNFAMFGGQEFTAVHEYGLLAIAILGAVLWTFTSPGERRVTVHLHSTQLISGGLFILIGLLMLEGRMTYFNSLISPEFAEWLAIQEDWLVSLFSK